MSSDDVIVTDNLVVRFRGKAALDGFTLRVPRGAVYALLGDNGAGKSTSMKVLTGQLPPDRGSASIFGLDCWARAAELRHRVGYVPDRVKMYDWMTVSEIGWFAAGFYRAGFLPRYEEWVDRLRLDRKKRLRELSKGGYARVGLALALAPDPQVLLLDEPTSGLDLLTRREFLASLVEFAAEGRTILISSHSIAELERTASHAAFVRDGKVVLAAPLDTLRSRFRRLSLRCDGVPPDPTALGTVHETMRTGRFVQYLVQDPDPLMVEGLRDLPGVTDFEDTAVTLEEIYAALMGHRPEAPSKGLPKAAVADPEEDELEEEEVRP
jgi:ABC-2 type transport system ATP-binding protein